MEFLIILWLLFLFGGRIIAALSRSKQRKPGGTTPPPMERRQVELEQLQSTQPLDGSFIEKSRRESEARTEIRQAATLQSRSTKRRNEGAGSRRNQSARMKQEQVRKSKMPSNRGKFAGSVKEYIESMSGSFSEETLPSSNTEPARPKRLKKPVEQGNVYGMSMGTDKEIDWDNYEADFLKDSDWSDEFDEVDGISQVLLSREQAVKAEKVPLETSQTLQPSSWRQAIVTSEILAKPKAARRR